MATPRAELVDGQLRVRPLTRREEAAALMDPEILNAMLIFAKLPDDAKQVALAEARRLLMEQLVEEAQ